MKAITTLAIALVITCTGAFCQLSKSAWMLNGEIGYQSLKEDGDDESLGMLTLNPKVGYLLTNSFMLGAGLNIISLSSGDFTYTESLIGPFVRYYSNMSEGSSIAFFGEGSYSFGSDKSKSQGDSEKDSKTAWTLGAGMAAFLGERVSLEPVIRYGSTKTKYDSSGTESKVNAFEFLVGLSVYIGGK